jgi:hypothetical protein
VYNRIEKIWREIILDHRGASASSQISEILRLIILNHIVSLECKNNVRAAATYLFRVGGSACCAAWLSADQVRRARYI